MPIIKEKILKTGKLFPTTTQTLIVHVLSNPIFWLHVFLSLPLLIQNVLGEDWIFHSIIQTVQYSLTAERITSSLVDLNRWDNLTHFPFPLLHIQFISRCYSLVSVHLFLSLIATFSSISDHHQESMNRTLCSLSFPLCYLHLCFFSLYPLYVSALSGITYMATDMTNMTNNFLYLTVGTIYW